MLAKNVGLQSHFQLHWKLTHKCMRFRYQGSHSCCLSQAGVLVGALDSSHVSPKLRIVLSYMFLVDEGHICFSLVSMFSSPLWMQLLQPLKQK